MNEQNTPQPRTFEERLQARRFVMTAEVTPPLSFDPEDLLRKAAPLRGLADAVNVTDGAGARAHMGALAAAAILDRAGIEPILQIACRDKNRIALQSELMGAAALGIRNLMLLGGDDPKAGEYQLIVKDIHSGTETPLVSGPEKERLDMPAWSPDGKVIVCYIVQPQGALTGLEALDAQGADR